MGEVRCGSPNADGVLIVRPEHRGQHVVLLAGRLVSISNMRKRTNEGCRTIMLAVRVEVFDAWFGVSVRQIGRQAAKAFQQHVCSVLQVNSTDKASRLNSSELALSSVAVCSLSCPFKATKKKRGDISSIRSVATRLFRITRKRRSSMRGTELCTVCGVE